MGGVNPELVERPLVFFLHVEVEDELQVRLAAQPAVGVNFTLELPGRPAGIPESEDRPIRSLTGGQRLQDIDGCGERSEERRVGKGCRSGRSTESRIKD